MKVSTSAGFASAIAGLVSVLWVGCSCSAVFWGTLELQSLMPGVCCHAAEILMLPLLTRIPVKSLVFVVSVLNRRC